MIGAEELMQCAEVPLDHQILKIVAEHEPIKRYQIADHCQTSRDRIAILGRVGEMRKAALLDIGDAEEGYIVMLTPEGREKLSEFEGSNDLPQPVEPAPENAGAPPESGGGKKSLLKRVVDFLVLHPGSTRDTLKKQFPDELRALSVALCEGRRNDRISMREDGEIETFHPGPNAWAKLAPNRKPSEKKSRTSPAVLSTDGKRIDRSAELTPGPLEGGAAALIDPLKEVESIREARENGETYRLPTGGGATSDVATATFDVAVASRFRVARTSDATIIIWGVTPDPIELDIEQSRTLVDFIGG